MPARTFGAVAITTALVLLPTAAHAGVPGDRAPQVAQRSMDRPVDRPVDRSIAVADASDPASPLSTDALVVLGLITLVGGALVLTLVGRRPDDDEPAE